MYCTWSRKVYIKTMYRVQEVVYVLYMVQEGIYKNCTGSRRVYIKLYRVQEGIYKNCTGSRKVYIRTVQGPGGCRADP